MKYLHTPSPGTIVLDHRLTPEVRAMLVAMVSRSPVGGMKQRYTEVVEAVAESLWNTVNPRHPWVDMVTWATQPRDAFEVLFRDEDDPSLNVTRWTLAADIANYRGWAEDALTVYPLHQKVQGFFDQFVGQYGHSSPMELTGSPTVGIEGMSWFTAWLLFDSPLVAGQEFSTRAVRRTDWPMARECAVPAVQGGGVIRVGDEIVVGPKQEVTIPHPLLQYLHREWLEVYEAEIAWWAEHLTDPTNRAALGIADKEPFRPALDRARWALPGTFATGTAFASHLRERARTIRDAQHVNQGPVGPSNVWSNIQAAYRAAAPGIAQYGLREAVIEGERDLPGHLVSILRPCAGAKHRSGVDVDLRVCEWKEDGIVEPYKRTRKRSYADPWFNRQVRVRVNIECSLAVARDWHRHRTLYPWHLGVVVRDENISLDRRYAPKSEVGIARTPELLHRSYALYRQFLANGDVERAALALPMGTRVVVSGAGGLRDVLYTLELRAHAHGANFEYKQQSEAALYLLETRARLSFLSGLEGAGEDVSVFSAVGQKFNDQ
jgi:hypothetical protein